MFFLYLQFILFCLTAKALINRPSYKAFIRTSIKVNNKFTINPLSAISAERQILTNAITNHAIKSEDEEEEEGEDDEEEEEGSDSSTGAVPVPVQEERQVSLIKQGLKYETLLNGKDVRVGIIMARWNEDIIQGLYKGVNESLAAAGVQPSNIFATYVPGSFELPVTARLLAASGRFDVIICLGCLIKGDTMHFEYIAGAVAKGIMDVSLNTMVPTMFGVLTVLNKEQAVVRSTGEKNEGLSWGRSAVEMGLARISAMGLDKVRSKVEKQSEYVKFDGKPKQDSDKATEEKTPRKFGF